MLVSSVWEHSSCSFFLIDRKNELLFFKIVPDNNLREFITGSPKIGDNVEEIITQIYKYKFLKLLEKCFNNKCFSIEVRIPSANEGIDSSFQIVFTPLMKDKIEQVVCTIIKNHERLDHLRKLNDYSHLTSHQLRSLTANVSSLFNVTSYSRLGGYDVSKINQLLSDVNYQAKKLDSVIKELCISLSKPGTDNQPENEGLEPEKKHVVLVDDDLMTIKVHQALIRNQHREKQVVLFNNPGNALDYIKQNKPDLILLDLHMPNIDGLRFLKMLDESKISIDVVIVSSSVDPMDRTIAKSFSFVKDFIAKPLTDEKVKSIFDH
ncbi:response regulator [Pedobacter panaciterrae]|uniref:Response regulator n=1 Tax=Pedobacter panaciterrae TaxID=363849 RepID=A0ABU8NHB8_9SPHI